MGFCEKYVLGKIEKIDIFFEKSIFWGALRGRFGGTLHPPGVEHRFLRYFLGNLFLGYLDPLGAGIIKRHTSLLNVLRLRLVYLVSR